MAKTKSRAKREKSSEQIVEQLNAPYDMPLRVQPFAVVVDVAEWSQLGAELRQLCEQKYDEVLVAIRKIVDAQRVLNGYERPEGAWLLEDSLDGERVAN